MLFQNKSEPCEQLSSSNGNQVRLQELEKRVYSEDVCVLPVTKIRLLILPLHGSIRESKINGQFLLIASVITVFEHCKHNPWWLAFISNLRISSFGYVIVTNYKEKMVILWWRNMTGKKPQVTIWRRYL